MSQTLKLADHVFQALEQTARQCGMAPQEWIASQLALDKGNGESPTAKEISRANARLRKHIISSGQRGPCDNAQIDRDLAREYGNDHARKTHREKR